MVQPGNAMAERRSDLTRGGMAEISYGEDWRGTAGDLQSGAEERLGEEKERGGIASQRGALHRRCFDLRGHRGAWT